MNKRFIILSIVVVILFIADLTLGSINLDITKIFSSTSGVEQTLLMNYRLPKAIVALLCGVALSVSGVIMQTIFRNPLAGPYTLGVSSGASLGVALFLLGAPLIGTTVASDMGVAFSAFIGASAVMFLVLAISIRLRDIMAVLILGMMLSSAAAAFVDVMQYFSTESSLKGFVLWAMGSLGGVSYSQILIMTVAVIAGLVLTTLYTKPLDTLILGENYARTLGIKMQGVRTALFVATSLLSGTITAFCGPIAFIGIAVPHIARMTFRTSSHRVLLPASALIGAAIMLICDIISSVPGSDIVLPINTITSLFGIPVVIMVVIRSGRGKIM